PVESFDQTSGRSASAGAITTRPATIAALATTSTTTCRGEIRPSGRSAGSTVAAMTTESRARRNSPFAGAPVFRVGLAAGVIQPLRAMHEGWLDHRQSGDAPIEGALRQQCEAVSGGDEREQAVHVRPLVGEGRAEPVGAGDGGQFRQGSADAGGVDP